MPRTKLDVRPLSVPTDWRTDLGGVTWTLTDLKDELHQNKDFVVDKILRPNQLELDVKYGGPVKYSTGHRNPWLIQARKMTYWIDKNWPHIVSGGW